MENIVKLYTTEYSRNKQSKLTVTGNGIFTWMLCTLNFDADGYFFFNRKQYMEERKIKSLTTVSNGIKELLIAGILTKTHKNSHYIVDKKVMDTCSEDEIKEDTVYKNLVSLYSMLARMKEIYAKMTCFDPETEEEEKQLLEVEAKIKECEIKIKELESKM